MTQGVERAWRRFLPLAVATAILGSMVSCAPPSRPVPTSLPAPVESFVAPRVVEIARQLMGTPYRYRGSDPSGFDCSGLTSYVFSGVGVPLPRRAEDQAKAGIWVPLDELEKGDLVFFGATRSRPHHVGVVSSGPGEPLAMIHASSSRGVVETEILESTYWLERLEQGRRVLMGK